MPANPSLTPTNSVVEENIKGSWKQTQNGTSSRFRPSMGRAVACLAFLAVVVLHQLSVDAFMGGAPIRDSVRRQFASRFKHGSNKRSAELLSNDGVEDSTSSKEAGCLLGLISFDLDDTLFPTATVVNEANQAMMTAMRDVGLTIDEEGDFLDQFRLATRTIRQNLASPITYTDLRKLAIRQVLEDDGVNADKIDLIVEDCFDAWLAERHASAERHLFDDAIKMLQSLKSLYPDVCIAAITNGRGNPLDMKDTLAPYFDYCVSGEDVDVFPSRKPASDIYEKSLERYRDRYPHHFEANDGSESNTSTSKKLFRTWVHVGDDLANDVAASAALGARAVWMFPDEVDTEDEGLRKKLRGEQATYSTATPSEEKERKELAAKAQNKVATRIRSLAELPEAIKELLQ